LRHFLSDLWFLLALALAQAFLTLVFVALVPYGYLVQRKSSDPDVAKNMQILDDYAQERPGEEMPWEKLIQDQGPALRALFEALPSFWLVVAGSVLIYPFLGWWSGRWLHHPQLGGLLIVGSVAAQKNIVSVPQNVEYLNLAQIGLSLPAILAVITLQFVLLTLGILHQRGHQLLEKAKEKESGL
jgi:hypothetical protein